VGSFFLFVFIRGLYSPANRMRSAF
jgi:hypothetical protein